MKLTLHIDGMSCEHCIHAVRSALEEQVAELAKDSTIDVELGRATIRSRQELPKANLIAAIAAAGPFRVSGFEGDR